MKMVQYSKDAVYTLNFNDSSCYISVYTLIRVAGPEWRYLYMYIHASMWVLSRLSRAIYRTYAVIREAMWRVRELYTVAHANANYSTFIT